MKNKQRQFRMAVKSLSEDGSFEGCLSPYNNVDEGADVVEPGAFTKTIQENGNIIPLLSQHKADCPIGQLALEDRPDGLYCKGQILLELPEAKNNYILLKAKVIKGLSIGYDAVKAQIIDGVRHLKEIRLYEGSVVTFPMNNLAMVTSVKSRGEVKGDFNEELNERQLFDASYQMICALQDALGQIPWCPDLTRAEMVSATEIVIQQFHDVYMEYLPAYLDVLAEMYGLDTKSWAGKRERKAGRTLSAATKGTLDDCHGHIKSAMDILAALLAEEAGEDSGDDPEDATSKAAAAAREHKSEPDTLHSAAESLKAMRALLQA
jgi:HK97 family phage prohead protease